MMSDEILCLRCHSDNMEDGVQLPPTWIVHPDRDDYETDNPLGTRGWYSEFRYRCVDCGFPQRVVVAGHKGALRLGVFPL